MISGGTAIGRIVVVSGLVILIFLSAVAILAVTNQPSSKSSGKSALLYQRSGPISTYPARWGLFSSCPGFSMQGNLTTLGIGNVTYPNSWNTTTIVTLNQVYGTIIDSSAFANIASGHGWVVYSWSFGEGGSNNPFPNGNTIMGYFMLTNATAPDGYVTAYYNIENGSVSLTSVTSTLTVICPPVATTTISG